MKQRIDKHAVTFPTILGLILALIAPLLYALLIGPMLLEPRMDLVAYSLTGFAVMWALMFAIFAVTLLGEEQPLTSIGVRPLTWKTAILAVGLGLSLSLLVPLATLFMSYIGAAVEQDGVTDIATRYPVWIIGGSVLTAGITEEVLFRAYPLERLRTLTGSVWPGALISLAAFVLVHAPGWHVSHVVGVVLPLGAMLTGLYLWRRNVLFVAITHIMIDLPLLFVALGEAAQQ
jgi:uncharacterized protein